MGFEPTISCVTGRRALQAAPRGRVVYASGSGGIQPTASLVLSQGGLPIAYRALSVPRTEVEPASRGARTHNSSAATYLLDRRRIRPDDFRRVKSSGGWNRTNGLLTSEPGVTTNSNYPGSCFLAGHSFLSASSGRRNRTLVSSLQSQAACH